MRCDQVMDEATGINTTPTKTFDGTCLKYLTGDFTERCLTKRIKKPVVGRENTSARNGDVVMEEEEFPCSASDSLQYSVPLGVADSGVSF